MTRLYPLAFEPEFKERVWGGRRLEQFYPSLPEGPIGEAWVISAHKNGPTVISNGPLAGQTIPELLRDYGESLVGSKWTSSRLSDFPLLLKILDSNDDLSVQVHPKDGYPGLAPGESGKAEMWLILDAAPKSKIVYGLAPGTTREQFAEAVKNGDVMPCLRQLEVHPGDVIPILPGTIHALGSGIVVAEPQQSSDTTYRVWDYNRVGLDGKPRQLHIEQALEVTNYTAAPEIQHPGVPAANTLQHLASFTGFDVFRSKCEGKWPRRGNPETFRALLVLEGSGSLAWPRGCNTKDSEEGCEQIVLCPGSSVLMPAALEAYAFEGSMTMLEVTLA